MYSIPQASCGHALQQHFCVEICWDHVQRSGKICTVCAQVACATDKTKLLVPCGIIRPMEWTNLGVGSLGDMYDVFK